MLDWLRRVAPNFVIAWGFSATLAALIGWVVDKVVAASASIPGPFIGLLLATFIFVYVGSICHIVLATPKATFKSPLMRVYKEGQQYPDGLFQFDQADWLIYNASYAVFVIENGDFERLLCVARVLIIQDDKKVQLIVETRAKGSQDVWDGLAKNPADFKQRVIIKPGVPLDV